MADDYEDDSYLYRGERSVNPGMDADEYEKELKEKKKEPLYDIDDFDDDNLMEADEDDDREKERETCPVCGKDLKFLNRRRVVRGLWICNDCEDRSAINRYTKQIRKYTPQDALNIVKNKIEKAENFTVTKSADDYMLIDDNRKLWTVPYAATVIKNTPKIDPELIFRYDEIKSYELVENGNLLAKGGVGLPPIGGLLFGSEGSGMSANSEETNVCENLQIRINLENMATPKVFVNLIFKETDKDKKAYGQAFLTAQKILSILEFICHKDKPADAGGEPEENKKESAGTHSAADEIKKYKELLDMGAITPEEYEAKKAKLLDL